MVNVRVDKELKEEAEQILKELGLDLPSGVRMFLKYIARTGSIPPKMLETRYSLIVSQVPEGHLITNEAIIQALRSNLPQEDVQEELEVADKDRPIFDGKGRKVPYWRIVTEQGCLGIIPHYSREEHKARLAAEGHRVLENGSRLTVEDYQDKLILKRFVLK